MELQKYKDDATRFDSSRAEYKKLVGVNFSDYDEPALEEGAKLTEMRFNNAEQGMLAMIEDINDQLNKDVQKKGGRNSVNIAFFDINSMSGPMQAFYLLFMFGAIFGALYFFYNLLVLGPEQKEAAKQRLRDEKKKKKTK